ncbi:TonB-dependent receptor [Riemerella columbina]|uniref:TonB-dependent receptor n=1 Tax=Riemerella columbina TaxID=103810 RepID=UPI00266F91C2|nr:TonB-dependent receptor [Riemerella columbina]WKS95074.1 TonB-dependent receptor [Riemerella columbina]
MIKKLSLISMFSLLPASFYYAQTTVYAYVKDANGKPIENAVVDVQDSNEDAKADKIGYFQLVDLMPGHYQIMVSQPNFEKKFLEFDVTANEKRKDLGVITLYSNLNGSDLGVVLLDDANDTDEASIQPTLGLLQSSRDVFSSVAAYDLGFYWFRPRGVDSRTSNVMMNGISMVNADRGNVDFSQWGGLNEVTRYPEIAVNHSPSEYAFGGVGSVVYKNMKASEHRKGVQLTQSVTNRNYRYRTSVRYSSGMNRNGWAFTIMGARRWAQEGIQEGTFYDAYGTYLGIEKKINDQHTLTFNFIGSPYRRSTASPATQEVYDYRGVHYNAYWGWQDGEKRSERVKTGFQPLFQLTDYWKINKDTQLWTTLSYQFGKTKASRLDWYNVQNPSPLYYKNLPSYYAGLDNPNPADLEQWEVVRNRWLDNDQKYTQIDWERLYRTNLNQKLNGGQAAYFLVNDVTDSKTWNVNTHLVHNLTDRTQLFLNLSYQNYISDQYREVKDLLGADYALNKDSFASSNQPKLSGLFNDGEEDTHKKVGDKIQYDYTYRRQEVKINPAVKFSTGRFDVFLSGLAAYTSNSREGKFNHYLYSNALGKSGDYNFWNLGLKGQIIYKIDGRNFLVYNGAYYSQAPVLNNLFINARTNNATIPNIKNTVISANDISYMMATPFVKMRATAYLIDTENDTNVQRFFADGIKLSDVDADGNATNTKSAFVTQVMANVNRRNMGVELGAEVKVSPTITVNGIASYGQYTYTNNPNVYYASDAAGVFSNGLSYKDYGVSYIKNFRQGGTPQQAYSVGIKYSSPKYWWVGVNWNYLGDNYLDPSPLLRSDFFLYNANTGTPYAGATEEEYRRLVQQVKLAPAYFFNINAGKSWMIGKYYILLTASVNNLLNNTKYATGGFEQARNVNFADFKKDHDRAYPYFAPKYFYTQGRSYFVNLQFRF